MFSTLSVTTHRFARLTIILCDFGSRMKEYGWFTKQVVFLSQIQAQKHHENYRLPLLYMDWFFHLAHLHLRSGASVFLARAGGMGRLSSKVSNQ